LRILPIHPCDQGPFINWMITPGLTGDIGRQIDHQQVIGRNPHPVTGRRSLRSA
jgi:hypothetical protein